MPVRALGKSRYATLVRLGYPPGCLNGESHSPNPSAPSTVSIPDLVLHMIFIEIGYFCFSPNFSPTHPLILRSFSNDYGQLDHAAYIIWLQIRECD